MSHLFAGALNNNLAVDRYLFSSRRFCYAIACNSVDVEFMYFGMDNFMGD